MSKIRQGIEPFWFKVLKKVLYNFKVILMLRGGDIDNYWTITLYKERDY